MIRVLLVLLPGSLALDHGSSVGVVGSHAPTTPLPLHAKTLAGSTGFEDTSPKSHTQSSQPRAIITGLHKELGFGLHPVTAALRQALKAVYGEEPMSSQRSSVRSNFLAPLVQAVPGSMQNVSAHPKSTADVTISKLAAERSHSAVNSRPLVRVPELQQKHQAAGDAEAEQRAGTSRPVLPAKKSTESQEALPGQALVEAHVQETVQWLQRPVEIRMPRYHWVVIVCLSLALFFAVRAYSEMFSAPRPWQKQSRVFDPPLFRGRAGAAVLGQWSPSAAGSYARSDTGAAAGTNTPLYSIAGPGYDTLPERIRMQRGN